MPEPFAGKVVVITGGAGGIGAALAAEYVDQGAVVALLDIDPDALSAVGRTLPAGRHLDLTCDIRDPEACRAAMEEIRRRLGGIDVLVNNAGTSHRSLFADTRLSVIRRIVEVNFFGAVHCTDAALADLRERRGVVVAISSVAGFAPLVGRTGYAASKHALHGFFDSLRAELRGSGVDVLVVCPSFVDTAMERTALGGQGAAVGDGPRAVAGKRLEPAAVARAIVRATATRRRLLLLSPVARASFWLSRLLPSVYERLMLRTQRREFPIP